MSDLDDDLALPDAIHALAAKYGKGPIYQTLWEAVASARIPAHRHGGRWRIRKADLPQVAAVLGLTKRSAA